MAQSGAYKQYARGTRSLILEEGFSKGMCSNSIPLADGQFKTIVNYQIQEDGNQLVPRKGRKPDDNILVDQSSVLYSTEASKIVTVLSGEVSYNTYSTTTNNFYASWLNKATTTKEECATLFVSTPLPNESNLSMKLYNLRRFTYPESSFPIVTHASAISSLLQYNAYPSKDVPLSFGGLGKVAYTDVRLLNMYVKYGNNISVLNKGLYAYETEEQDNSRFSFSTTPAINKMFLGPIHNGDIGASVYNNTGLFKVIPRPIFSILNGALFSPAAYSESTVATSSYTFNQDLVVNDSDLIASNNAAVPDNSFIVGRVSKQLTVTNNSARSISDYLNIDHVTPAEPDFAEIYSTGFNILLPSPYTAENLTGAEYELIGALLYEDAACTKVATEYTTGTQIYVKPNYYYAEDSSATLTCKCQIDSSSVSKTLYTGTISNGDAIAISFNAPAGGFNLIFEIAQGNNIISASSWPFPGGAESKDTFGSLRNLTAKNYDLTTATGMLTWKQRIVLWGVEGAPNVIFTSLPNRVDYFPYPNNVEVVANSILHITPFNDSLLIFTTDAIYKMSLKEDGSGYVTELVAADVNMTYDDTYAIVPVKKMLFYKSGNYYYMLVPSTKYATLGELNVAAVSAPINYFLDHFTDEVKSIIINMYSEELNYPKPEDITITPDLYNAYLANTDVCLDHVLNITVGETTYNVSLILKYNTVLRTWSMDLIGLTNNYVQLAIKNVAGVPVYSTYTDVGAAIIDNASTVHTSNFTHVSSLTNVSSTLYTYGDVLCSAADESPTDFMLYDSFEYTTSNGTTHTIKYKAIAMDSAMAAMDFGSTTPHAYYGFLLNHPTLDTLPANLDFTDAERVANIGPIIVWDMNNIVDETPTMDSSWSMIIYSTAATYTEDAAVITSCKFLFDSTHITVPIVSPTLLTDDVDNCNDTFVEGTLPTKQFLDTGYRAFNIANKKRMREVQFKVNNKLGVPLQFKTGFILDNERRVDLSNYTLDINSDGQFIVNSTAAVSNVTPVDVTGESVFVNDADDLGLNENAWYLDKSNLTVNDTATVRWRVSGKGYLPRITLLSENIKSYELLGIGWAARLMNTR